MPFEFLMAPAQLAFVCLAMFDSLSLLFVLLLDRFPPTLLWSIVP
jgi:hypothetical protein